MQVTYIANKYSGKCNKCGCRVDSFQGICFKPAGVWLCGCRSCYPLEASKVYADQERAKAVLAMTAMELEARRFALVLERKALIEKLGLCMDSPFDQKNVQLSYSDYSEWSIPFNGDGTDEEFNKVFSTPAQSMQGQLRASGGTKLVGINRAEGYVVVSETAQICD